MLSRPLVKAVMSQHSVKSKLQSTQVGVESSQVKLSVLCCDSLSGENSLESVKDSSILTSVFSDDDCCVVAVGEADTQKPVLIRVIEAGVLLDVDLNV